MKIHLFLIFSTYKELVLTGGIQSIGESENIRLDIRGNLAGDILIFIAPKNKRVSDNRDIIELIRTDRELVRQRQLVLESLRNKFRSITMLPESLVWFINAWLAALYAYQSSERIHAFVAGDIDFRGILLLLPLLLIIVATPFLGKAIGFKLLKPALFFIIKAVKFIRKVRNHKVA